MTRRKAITGPQGKKSLMGGFFGDGVRSAHMQGETVDASLVKAEQGGPAVLVAAGSADDEFFLTETRPSHRFQPVFRVWGRNVPET